MAINERRRHAPDGAPTEDGLGRRGAKGTLTGARVRYAGRTVYTIIDENADSVQATFAGDRGVVLATGPRGHIQPLFLQFDNDGRITHAATASRPWRPAEVLSAGEATS